MGGADRRGEAGFGPERVAAGDEGEIVGAAAQLVDRSAIRSSNRQASPTRRTSASRGTGWRRRRPPPRPEHPFAPAGGGRQVEESTSRLSSPPRWRRRAAALIGHTAGKSAALKIRARRRAPRADRTAGGRRGRSSARDARLRRVRRNPGRVGGRRFSGRRFRAGFRRDGDENLGAASELGGEVEGGGGGQRDRACGGARPSWVARRRPPSRH